MSSKLPTQSAVCPPENGTMPSCAPMAVPYVPFQQTNSAKYGSRDALRQGTLYPALNLPFHLKKNGSEVAKTPLTELQALCFVIHELGLYLDTHAEDTEAFALFQKYVAMEQSAREAYLKDHGPITQTEAAMDDHYTWLEGKWPWESEEVQK